MTQCHPTSWHTFAGVALLSAALLMTELALTRIFSVTMYYHFAFLAISIALFGLSASGVYVFVLRHRLERYPTDVLLAWQALVYSSVTILALAVLVHIRVGLNYSSWNLALMVAIYLLAALPFLTGGAAIAIAVSRLRVRINALYAADLAGAAAGCLLIIPLLDVFGAPGAVIAASACAAAAAVLFAPAALKRRMLITGACILSIPAAAHVVGAEPFEVLDTKGHQGDRVLFSKWNSFSRVAVYERSHGDWSLSSRYTGPHPETRFMDIDSAAATPILRFRGALSEATYLRSELTALVYHLKDQEAEPVAEPADEFSNLSTDGHAPVHGFTALVIGPGGGRDLLSALVFGARRVVGVEVNPIIVNDVMKRRFAEYSGDLYTYPGVSVTVDDGRSFVRRSPERFDVIQASLVDTWAATAAGAYTLTENTLYTVEAFDDYLDHLTDDGVLSITRWVFDGLRLVSLAQQVCEKRGWRADERIAVIRSGRVATFLLKRTPFTVEERRRLTEVSARLDFEPLYIPGVTAADSVSVGRSARQPDDGTDEYRKLILARDRQAFYAQYPLDIRPTTDDRPFFFHTTKIRNQMQVAFGRTMLFGNGLSSLMTLMGISVVLVALFVLIPLAVSGPKILAQGTVRWLMYFAALGAGFMVIEMALVQRFVLLLGHPVYSLTVTLFALLLGTGLGSYASRHLKEETLARAVLAAIACVLFVCFLGATVLPALIDRAIALSKPLRLALAGALMMPVGIALGLPLPAGVRLLSLRRPDAVPWAWGINGAFSVLGTTAGVFVAMNWGFSVAFLAAAAIYGCAGVLGFLHHPASRANR